MKSDFIRIAIYGNLFMQGEYALKCVYEF